MSCLATATPGSDPEADALQVYDQLLGEIKRLTIFRNGEDYKVVQLNKEGMKCAGSVDKSNLCAKRLETARRRSIKLTRMIANAELLRSKMDDAAVAGTLLGVLKQSHLTMAALVQRLDPEMVETLMDGLREHGDALAHIQGVLAEPLAAQPEEGDEEEEEEGDTFHLPDVPVHSIVVSQAANIYA